MTKAQKVTASQVLAAYDQFWHNVAFRKGWRTPPLQKEVVKPLLQTAADVVSRVRSQKKLSSSDLPLAGAAHEFFWAAPTDPKTEPEKFIEHGLMDGVTEKEIVQFADQYMDSIRNDALQRLRRTETALQQRMQEAEVALAKLKEVRMDDEAIRKDEEKEKRSEAEAEMEADVATEVTKTAETEETTEAKELKEEEKNKNETQTRKPLKRQPSDAKILKINTIAKDLNEIDASFGSLRQQADLLNTTSENDPDALAHLQQRCIETSGRLLRDLDALDAVEGGKHSRPFRKEQIKRVNRMLDDVEQIQDKLKARMEMLQQRHKEQNEKEREERKREKEAEEKEVSDKTKPEEQERAAKKPKVDDKKGEEDKSEEEEEEEMTWADMQLPVRFEARDLGEVFSLQVYLPRLDADSVSVNSSPTELAVKGTVLPSESDEERMKERLDAVLERLHKTDEVSEFQKKLILYRMGAGQFGTFSEKYQLPDGVDVDNICATYDSGVLRITIPKSVERLEREKKEREERAAASSFNPYMHNPAHAPGGLGGLSSLDELFRALQGGGKRGPSSSGGSSGDAERDPFSSLF